MSRSKIRATGTIGGDMPLFIARKLAETDRKPAWGRWAVMLGVLGLGVWLYASNTASALLNL
ncbi:MAG: hypothetical protein ABFS30_04870 [Pseudomonadota bacterium]